MDSKGTVVREADRDWETWPEPESLARSGTRWKTLLSADRTPTGGLTLGVAEIPPGAGLPPHRHPPAEAYFVQSGEGYVEIEDRRTAVAPGAAVFIPPGARHGMVNTGDGPLRFLYVLAVDSLTEVDYRFEE